MILMIELILLLKSIEIWTVLSINYRIITQLLRPIEVKELAFHLRSQITINMWVNLQQNLQSKISIWFSTRDINLEIIYRVTRLEIILNRFRLCHSSHSKLRGLENIKVNIAEITKSQMMKKLTSWIQALEVCSNSWPNHVILIQQKWWSNKFCRRWKCKSLKLISQLLEKS